MSENLQRVYVSGGLLAPSIIADALSDAPRKGEFKPDRFGWPGHEAEPARAHAESIQTAFDLVKERYDAIAADIESLSVTDLREKWLLPLMRVLDFEPVFQRAHLPSPDGRQTFAITHLAWQGENAPPVILTTGDLDSPAGGSRSPHDELQQFLNLSPAQWGMVANGTQLRLVRDFYHTYTKAFIGFDIAAICEERDFAAFRALYRLAHRSRLHAEKNPPLEALFQVSQAEGIQIGKELQPQVREAITLLARGLFDDELKQLARDPKGGRQLFHELLLVVYRILFMLFAEQRKMLPHEGIYADTYSITSLSRIAENRLAEPWRKDLWEGLKVSFALLSKGLSRPGGGFEVYPFNGQLFDLRRTSHLMARSCDNDFLLKAIRQLTFVEVGKLRQRVNYAELGVEELGSVYETLLSYTIRVADELTVLEDREVPAGQAHLAPLSTERSDLGAHYTRPELVDFVLSVSLDKLIAERLQAAGGNRAARERALLDLRICDPACGSGAFLVGAIDRVALALARERAGGEKPTEQAVQRARRDVLASCIYGVDKDAFAVELCKVALWIHCAVPDLPLNFLDHRIQHGDSLVGWPLLNVPSTIPADAYSAPSGADARLKAYLRDAKQRNDDVLAGQRDLLRDAPMPDVRIDFPAIMAEDERQPADVERKDAAFRGYEQSAAYQRFKAAADLWTAAFFWSHEVGHDAPTTAAYRQALNGTADTEQAQAAAELLEEFPAFHWPLRFPEIAARGGFDCFVGNPPWEQVKLQEQEWFGPHAPEIALMPSALRAQAIAQLPQTNPTLHRRWLRAKMSYDRLAEYTRTCGRFGGSGHEPNTYLLFSEHFADALHGKGRAGIIVKSGLGMDLAGAKLFERLTTQGKITDFYDTINQGPGAPGAIFKDVAAVERFAVLGLRGEGEAGASFTAGVMNYHLHETLTKPRQTVNAEFLATLSPHTKTLTSFRTENQLQVALQIHRAALRENSGLALLDFAEGGSNPWGLKYVRLFDSSGAAKKGLFHRREDLEADGWRLGEDKVFRRRRAAGAKAEGQRDAFATKASPEELALPVLEGQLVDRYNHRAKSYEFYTGSKKYGRKPHIPACKAEFLADPDFELEPRYWMLDKDLLPRLADKVPEGHVMLAFRDVGAPWTNRRSAKAALVPMYGATHKLPVLILPRRHSVPFLCVFNSLTFDFMVRGHMPGGAVALVWMLSQIPVPYASSIPGDVVAASHRLSITSKSVAAVMGIEPHPWDPAERRKLDAQIDATVAHLYGLTRAQYAVVIDSFELQARKEVEAHGEYRTKKRCLEAYDRVGG